MTLDEQREQLISIITKKTDDPIQRAIDTFTYVRDHPLLLDQSPFREITMNKIVEMRAYIREQHRGFSQSVREFYKEKTEDAHKNLNLETLKSRRFHPLQNVMDDVWELLKE